MTEAEWLSAVDPGRMLRFSPPNEAIRKTWLFKCVCCRRIWHLLTDARSRRAVEVAERYADGVATLDELSEAAKEAAVAVQFTPSSLEVEGMEGYNSPLRTAAEAAECTASNSRFVALGIAQWVAAAFGSEAATSNPPYNSADYLNAHSQASQFISTAIRDIFGNPFRPVVFTPEWRTDTTVSLAWQMYELREFSAMPILADALQDAGCDNPDILNHCRNTAQVHVRGCWVCDLVLGKV